MNLEDFIKSELITPKEAQGYIDDPSLALETELSDSDALRIIADSARHLRSEVDRLQNQVEHDALTGLASREYFQSQLLKAHQRYLIDTSKPYTLFVLDLDSFKAINDSYGHVVGDGVLRHAGRVIQNSIRPFDLAGRLGGDEFVALINSGMNSEEAEGLIDRVGSGLSDFIDLTNEIAISADMKAQLSISAGYAQPTPDEDATSVLHRADQHMYEMKFSKR